MERERETRLLAGDVILLSRQTRCHIGRRHASLVKSGCVCSKKWRLRNLQGFRMRSVQAGKQTREAVVVQMWRFNGCQRRPAGRRCDGEEVDVNVEQGWNRHAANGEDGLW